MTTRFMRSAVSRTKPRGALTSGLYFLIPWVMAAAPAQAQVTEDQRLLQPGTLGEPRFGLAVEVQGGEIFVSAHVRQSVVVFKQDCGIWQADQVLSPAEPCNGFGRSISVDGDTLAVGTNGAYRVHVYGRSNGDWEEVDRLTSVGNGYETKRTVALKGYQIAAVGSSGITFFERDDNGWGLASFVAGSFGNQLDLTPDRAVIGEPGFTGGAIGETYVIERTSGGWLVVTAFGQGALAPVAIEGDLLATANEDLGSVYLYETPGLGWPMVGELTPSDMGVEEFGRDVYIQGDRVVVGALGAAYVFEREESGAWVQIKKLIPSDGVHTFGYSVAIDGDVVVVGANTSGPAYVFRIRPVGGVHCRRAVQ